LLALQQAITKSNLKQFSCKKSVLPQEAMVKKDVNLKRCEIKNGCVGKNY